MSLARSTAVIGGFTGLSRILGFAREMLLVAALGAGPISDAFFVALRLPNLFRRWLGEGALNAAFVPLYTKAQETDRKDAERFASETVSFLVLVLAVLTLSLTLAMPWVLKALAPGYADDAQWMARAVPMAQITMPYIAFMSLMALYGGVLSAHKRFAAFAFAPSVLNVVLIAVLVWRGQGDPWGTAMALAWGVLIAGVLQAGVVWLGLKKQGVRIQLRLPKLTPGVKRVLVLGVPGAIAAGVTQFNIVISQILARFQEGAVTWLAIADRVYQLPLGVVGIAMGVALLPTLSRAVGANDPAAGQAALDRALEIAAFLTLPAAAALAAASPFWVQALFERGAFDAEDTANTAKALLAFAVGLPAFIAVKVLSPAYFAREDTATPMRIAAVAVGVNVVLGVALFVSVGFVGLAVATSVAGYVNAGLLAGGLVRRRVWTLKAGVMGRLARLVLASAVCAGAVWWLAPRLRPLLDEGLAVDLAAAFALTVVGFGVYALAAVASGGVRLADMRAALRRSRPAS